MDWNNVVLIVVPSLMTLSGILVSLIVQSKIHIKQIEASFDVERKRTFFNNKIQAYEEVVVLCTEFSNLIDKVKSSHENTTFMSVESLSSDLQSKVNMKMIYFPEGFKEIIMNAVIYANSIYLIYQDTMEFESKIKLISEYHSKFELFLHLIIECIQKEYER